MIKKKYKVECIAIYDTTKKWKCGCGNIFTSQKSVCQKCCKNGE